MKFEKQLSSCSRHTLKVSLVLPALAFATAFSAVMPDEIYASQPTFCDHEEHVHGPECWADEEVSSSENTEPAMEQEHENETGFDSITGETVVNPEENQEPETNRVLVCNKEVHTHKVLCYADTKVDLETEEDWKKTLPKEKKDTLGETIAETAKSQLGEKSSEKNYTEDAAGAIQFLSRYGQWIGEPYGDPALPFAAFVLHYAGAEEIELNWKEGFDKFLESNEVRETPLIESSSYVPVLGDLIIFKDVYDSENPQRVLKTYIGFVTDLDPRTVVGAFGNYGEVQELQITDDAFTVEGYLHPTRKNQEISNSNSGDEGKSDEETEDLNQPGEPAEPAVDADQKSENDVQTDSGSPAEDSDNLTNIPTESLSEPDDSMVVTSEGVIAVGNYRFPERVEITKDDLNIRLSLKESDLKSSFKNGDLADLTPMDDSDASETITVSEEDEAKHDQQTSDEIDLIESQANQEKTNAEYPLNIELDLEFLDEADPEVAVLKEKIEADVQDAVEKSETDEQQNSTDEEEKENYIRPVFRLNGEDLLLKDIPVHIEISPTDESLKEIADEEDTAPEVVEEVGLEISLTTMTESKLDTEAQSFQAIRTEENEELQGKITSYSVAQTKVTNSVFPDVPVTYYIQYQKPKVNNNAAKKIEIMDTEKGHMPENKKGQKSSPIGSYINEEGKSTSGLVNVELKTVSGTEGQKGAVYEIAKTTEYVEGYTSETFNYRSHPNLKYWNKLATNGNFRLVKVLVSMKGASSPTTFNPASVHFTNRKKTAEDKGYIYIPDVSKIELRYDEIKPKDPVPMPAMMHDYDITDPNKNSTANGVTTTPTNSGGTTGSRYTEGKLGTAYGINSNDNYKPSISASTKPFANSGIIAFGNANTGTGMNRTLWNGNALSMYNSAGYGATGDSYQGCTFNMALSGSGTTVNYAAGIKAPDLFSASTVTGKTTYTDVDLKFQQHGDTHILTAVEGTGNNTQSGKDPKGTIQANNLHQFSSPYYKRSDNKAEVFNEGILTNNFWPMDNIWNADPHTGGNVVHDGKNLVDNKYLYNGLVRNGKIYTNGYKKYPASDDGKAHNNLFGMNFEIKFNLPEDYIGPLVYTFFGDDDMWVFLDHDTPIVDIGGVHSSVGQRVNLSTYLRSKENGKLVNKVNGKSTAGEHTLSFFYTERGLSGSTCYMEFTLPNVSKIAPEIGSGNLEIAKEVVGVPGDRSFDFKIGLSGLDDQYSYTIYKNDNTTESDLFTYDGGTISLKGGEKAVIQYLPQGTPFTIEELNSSGYSVSYFGESITKDDDGKEIRKPISGTDYQDGSKVSGTIGQNTTILYTFRNAWTELPATGASGFIRSMIGGFILIGASATVIVVSNRKRSTKNRK